MYFGLRYKPSPEAEWKKYVKRNFNSICYPNLLSFSVAPEEGYSCLTEILDIKFILFSRPVSLSVGFITNVLPRS